MNPELLDPHILAALEGVGLTTSQLYQVPEIDSVAKKISHSRGMRAFRVIDSRLAKLEGLGRIAWMGVHTGWRLRSAIKPAAGAKERGGE